MGNFFQKTPPMENPWKKHGHASHMENPQEGNLGAPVLFAAQDGALPESHRQELLEARKRRYQPVTGDQVGFNSWVVHQKIEASKGYQFAFLRDLI